MCAAQPPHARTQVLTHPQAPAPAPAPAQGVRPPGSLALALVRPRAGCMCHIYLQGVSEYRPIEAPHRPRGRHPRLESWRAGCWTDHHLSRSPGASRRRHGWRPGWLARRACVPPWQRNLSPCCVRMYIRQPGETQRSCPCVAACPAPPPFLPPYSASSPSASCAASIAALAAASCSQSSPTSLP